MNNLFKFIISIIVCQSAGIFGSLFSFEAVPDWYSTLTKPDFAPPNWIFAPTWIILYFLMGMSLYLVWKNKIKSKERKNFFIMFGIQLFLNAIWSFFFFGLKSPLFGLIDILFLDIFVIITMIYSRSVLKLATILLIPYLGWIIFATIINYKIVILN